MGGKQKNKKNTNAENKRLRKSKGRTMHFPAWFQIATTLRLHDLREPVHIRVCIRPLTAKQTAPSWTQKHRTTSISLLLTRLNYI